MHTSKKQYVGRDSHGGLEGTRVRNSGAVRGVRYEINVHTKVEQTKTNNSAKKQRKRVCANVCTSLIYRTKKASTKWAENSTRTKQTGRANQVKQTISNQVYTTTKKTSQKWNQVVKNEEVTSGRTCVKQHIHICSIYQIKSNQTLHKTTVKNEASRQMHIQSQKLNQQTNQWTIDFARHIFKQTTKCKNETSKNNAPLNSQKQNINKT